MEGYVIDGNELDILNEDWDILIILDACRFDAFSDVYKEFFEDGILKKAISPATHTMEFLNKIFKGFYDDIIYISATPFVNSSRTVTHRENGKTWTFNASKHFHKVVDAWDFGWNEELQNVHPKEVNKAFIREYLKYPKKRFILHYMQPHRPFISVKEAGHSHTSDDNAPQKLSIKGLAQKYLSETLIWKIKKVLGIKTNSVVEKIYRNKGWDGVKEIYKNEIRLALKYVSMIVNSISANYIITADHGERLGEYLFRDRHAGKRDREVIEVPWMEIGN